MTNRLALDDNVKASFSNFVKFISDKDGICEVHDAIAPDIDLCVFADEYKDVKQSSKDNRNPKAVLQALCTSMHNYDALKKVLARILVFKPHSADFERLVSAYSLMKTSSRNHLQCQTISNNLHINLNIPLLAQYDSQRAVHYFMTDRKCQNRDTPKVEKSNLASGKFSKAKILHKKKMKISWSSKVVQLFTIYCLLLVLICNDDQYQFQ